MTDEIMIQKIKEVLQDKTVLFELVKCADVSCVAEVFRQKAGMELTETTALEVWQSMEDAGLCCGQDILNDADLEKVTGGIGPIEFPPRRRGEE